MKFKKILFITVLVASFTAYKKDEPAKPEEKKIEDTTYVRSTKF